MRVNEVIRVHVPPRPEGVGLPRNIVKREVAGAEEVPLNTYTPAPSIAAFQVPARDDLGVRFIENNLSTVTVVQVSAEREFGKLHHGVVGECGYQHRIIFFVSFISILL